MPRNCPLSLMIALKTPRTRMPAPISSVGRVSRGRTAKHGGLRPARWRSPASRSLLRSSDRDRLAADVADDPGDLDPLVLIAGIGELVQRQAQRLRQRRLARAPAAAPGPPWPAAHDGENRPKVVSPSTSSSVPRRQFFPSEGGVSGGRNVNPAALVLHEHQRRVGAIQGDHAANADRVPRRLFRRSCRMAPTEVSTGRAPGVLAASLPLPALSRHIKKTPVRRGTLMSATLHDRVRKYNSLPARWAQRDPNSTQG